MKTRTMIIADVTLQDPAQMPFVYHDHVVQTFSTKASDNAFRITFLQRTTGRCRHLLDAQSVHSSRKIMSINPITISHEVSRRGFFPERLARSDAPPNRPLDSPSR